MIARIGGVLETVTGTSVVLRLAPGTGTGLELAVEVLIPASHAQRLEPRVGERVVLHTLTVLESPNQGASFVPRLLGFESADERAFFELLTGVKGIGTRKALRVMSEPAGVIAGMVVARDTRALQRLPEIGKRLAETMVAELSDRVTRFAEAGAAGPAPRAGGEIEARWGRLPAPARDAVEALITLGEAGPDAERKVARVVSELGEGVETEAILAAVFGRR